MSLLVFRPSGRRLSDAPGRWIVMASLLAHESAATPNRELKVGTLSTHSLNIAALTFARFHASFQHLRAVPEIRGHLPKTCQGGQVRCRTEKQPRFQRFEERRHLVVAPS